MDISRLESKTYRTGSLLSDLWQAALATLVRRWIAQIRSNLQIRRGIKVLMALDDRMLSDIGLTRGAVEYAARHGQVPPHGAGGGGPGSSAAASDRNPAVGAGKPMALSAVLTAELSFAACAIILTEAAAEAVVGKARAPTPSPGIPWVSTADRLL
jgi:uncharacterized protein YjiS (DUF1127 family)